MIPKVWRLSENSGDDNLGLACTEQGLVLGRTALIERRDGRFVVRERNELEHLLSRAYRMKLNIDGLMPGFATVAAALNANDQALARIAAVHLRVPDLPDQAARDEMESADVLLNTRAPKAAAAFGILLCIRARFSRQVRTIRSIPVGRPERRADVADNFVRRTDRTR